MKRLIPLSFSLLALTLGGIAHAEGTPYEDPTAEGAVKPVVKKRPKPKPKPAPVVTTPTAPIAYTAYAASPDIAKALTPAHEPAPLAPLPPPVAITPAPIAALPVQPVTAPPPPAPVPAPPSSQSANLASSQISLKCETQLTQGKRFLSQGTFYIDLFPSAVFPEEQADFKFLFVDPAHPSLIRESICLDTMCSANVTGTAYYLVNRVTKRGSALRITLDRSNGAFYAEEIDSKRIGKDAHRGEKGYCTPQKLPNTLF
jgi:hypothetical protein